MKMRPPSFLFLPFVISSFRYFSFHLFRHGSHPSFVHLDGECPIAVCVSDAPDRLSIISADGSAIISKLKILPSETEVVDEVSAAAQ